MSRKKGVIFSYILMIFESLSSILFTPYLIRCLGQSEYGIYGLVASVTAYLYLLDLGVGNAIVRYMAKYRFDGDRNSERNLMATTMVFYGIIAVIVIAVGVALNFFLPQIFGTGLSEQELALAGEMLQITVITAAVSLFFSPVTKTLIAYEKFVLSKCIEIIKIAIRVGLCCAALALGGKGVAIVSINLIVTAGVGIFSMLYTFVKLKITPRIKGINFRFIKEIWGYTFFIMLQMIATQINSMVDHILIGAFVAASTTYLAVYTAATQITQYFQSFGTAVNGVLMPGVVKMVENKASAQALQNEMTKVSRLIFMFLGIVYVGFALFGKSFMSLWAGEDYRDGYYVALIIMFPMLLSLSQSIGTQILWALNRHKVQAVLKICIAVMNIFLTFFLIQWNPTIGAATGTAIALLLGDVVVMNIVFRKDIGISVWQYYLGTLKGILPALLVSGGIGYAFSLIDIKGWLGLILNILVLCVVYLTLMCIFGLNDDERRMFARVPILNKILKVKEKNEE